MAVRQRPASRAPGQHFLRSSRLASELVREAGVADGDLVVDIGAGSGMLTRPLARTGARVVALELDHALASSLRRRFAAGEVAVLEIDALCWEWPRKEFSVVSNLPFGGSGSILARLLRDPRLPLRRADVIVQWEFAAKHSRVWPATLQGTYWRAWYELAITDRLSRSAFTPTPNVDAALLRITRRQVPLVAPERHDRYWDFLSTAFRARSPLGRALAPHLSAFEIKRLAAALGFSRNAYPRDLDPRQWAGVFAFAQKRVAHGKGASRKPARRTRSK